MMATAAAAVSISANALARCKELLLFPLSRPCFPTDSCCSPHSKITRERKRRMPLAVTLLSAKRRLQFHLDAENSPIDGDQSGPSALLYFSEVLKEWFGLSASFSDFKIRGDTALYVACMYIFRFLQLCVSVE